MRNPPKCTYISSYIVYIIYACALRDLASLLTSSLTNRWETKDQRREKKEKLTNNKNAKQQQQNVKRHHKKMSYSKNWNPCEKMLSPAASYMRVTMIYIIYAPCLHILKQDQKNLMSVIALCIRILEEPFTHNPLSCIEFRLIFDLTSIKIQLNRLQSFYSEHAFRVSVHNAELGQCHLVFANTVSLPCIGRLWRRRNCYRLWKCFFHCSHRKTLLQLFDWACWMTNFLTRVQHTRLISTQTTCWDFSRAMRERAEHRIQES